MKTKAILVAIGVALMLAVGAPVAQGDGGADDSGLRVIGFMPYALKPPAYAVNSPQFFTVPSVHRGFMLATEAGATKENLVVYDLVRLRRIGSIDWPSTFRTAGMLVAVDDAHGRVFAVSPNPDLSANPIDCSKGTFIAVVDARRLSAKSLGFPCVGGVALATVAVSYYSPTNKLYVVGMPPVEDALGQNNTVPKQSAIFAQLDADTLKVDWVVNASTRCDWVMIYDNKGVIARVGDNLFSYCYQGGPNYNYGGVRGAAIVIPLRGNAPITENGQPVMRVSPTFTYSVYPTIDPETGRFLLRVISTPYGPAVWGFDARHDRFFGVVPAGADYTVGAYDEFNGFDPISGRLYRLIPGGLVVVDGRQERLSGGVVYPVLTKSQRGGEHGGLPPTQIGIDGSLGRLFFPYPKKNGFVVVEDRLPATKEAAGEDPDQGTADIPEIAGRTESNLSGAANAFGLHAVVVGGLAGAVDNWDQTCLQNQTIPSPRLLDPQRRCLADQLISSGNREYFFAQTGLELPSAGRTAAFGAVFHVSSNDTATGTDFRSIAGCFSDRLPDQVPVLERPIPSDQTDEVGAACRERSPLGDFQNGTQDPQGRDYPFPGAQCVDEIGRRDEKGETGRIGDSRAVCDSSKNHAQAAAESAVAAIPAFSSPLLTVAHVSSSVSTETRAEGVVTTVTAIASGIKLAGVMTIGRVFTEAVTKAHGRSGSTSAQFTRIISDVHGPGIDCASTCDPQAVVDAFNQISETQVRLRILEPFALKSPRGYQSLVVKDPGLQASDIVILNDDTDTFNGLDVIINNDGAGIEPPRTRSRFVIGLAGVHAESRYGIFPITQGGGGVEVPPGPGVLSPLPTLPGNQLGPQAQPPVGNVGGVPTPAQVIRQIWRFIVNHPGQAALLFVLWLLLASPLYFGLRSGSLMRALRARA